MRTYAIAVETDLDPMDFWDEFHWDMQVGETNPEKRELLYQKAVGDTLDKWAQNYLELPDASFIRSDNGADFTIKLVTDTFGLDSVPERVDYSDQETVLGEVNVSATLTVESAQGALLLEETIPYYLNDSDGPTTTLRVRHFLSNPTFKLKLKLTKDPEKRKHLWANRIKRFEADILESFMKEAGKILKDRLLFQNKTGYAALFFIKERPNDKLNKKAKAVQKSINALSAHNKRKRKTLDEIQPELESAVILWQRELPKTKRPFMQDALNANIALTSLLLNDMMAAKLHLSNIPEVETLDDTNIIAGSFSYYLKGLQEAIASKEFSGNRLKVSPSK